MHAGSSGYEMGYELLDAGDERRLERFGGVVVDRPAPTALAPRRDPAAWDRAAIRFDPSRSGRVGHWTVDERLPDPWLLAVDGCILELRPTETGQVGVFPEHDIHWTWLRDRVAERLPSGPVEVLHLFAFSGAATLVAAGAGASVVHVDASRPAVAWGRRNAERSELGDRPIRWIVDDAGAFVAREVRRGRRYAGLLLDPPSYGHGPRGQAWHLIEDLDPLLDDCAALLAPDAFVLLTAHTPGEGPEPLGHRLARVGHRLAAKLETGDLRLAARSGVGLHLGAWARFGGPR